MRMPPRVRTRSVLAAMVVLAIVGGYVAAPYVRAAALVARAAQMGGTAGTLASLRAHPVQVDAPHPVRTRYGDVPAQFYRPTDGFSRVMILIPGIHSMGIAEPRLTGLAHDLAASGVLVMTLALPDLQRYAITARATDVIEDADVSCVLVDPRLQHLLPHVPVPKIPIPAVLGRVNVDRAYEPRPLGPDTPALMLYTSGTTGKPKGVVHSHATTNAQIACLIAAWEWTPDDRIPHYLPLHHVHGLVNKLLCPLWVGARCDFFSRFDSSVVFEALASKPYSIFMAVPTIYSKAIAAWEAADEATQQR